MDGAALWRSDTIDGLWCTDIRREDLTSIRVHEMSENTRLVLHTGGNAGKVDGDG